MQALNQHQFSVPAEDPSHMSVEKQLEAEYFLFYFALYLFSKFFLLTSSLINRAGNKPGSGEQSNLKRAYSQTVNRMNSNLYFNLVEPLNPNKFSNPHGHRYALEVTP